MNYNANETIKEDEFDDGVRISKEIKVFSYKNTGHVRLIQNENVINLTDFQLHQLRKLFIDILD